MKVIERRDLAPQVLSLQMAMLEMPQITEELVHHFARGLYAREMRVPRGTLVVGKLHRYDCLNFIIQGVAEVASADGRYQVKAPEIFTSPAGTKRAIMALEDLIWVTVHASKETDLDKLETELIEEEICLG